MKKLYLYIRLSDADDDLKFKTESESIANQRTLLYRFIRARREFDGYEVVEFIDDGYSGTNGHRPSFERMIESLKNGEARGKRRLRRRRGGGRGSRGRRRGRAGSPAGRQ